MSQLEFGKGKKWSSINDVTKLGYDTCWSMNFCFKRIVARAFPECLTQDWNQRDWRKQAISQQVATSSSSASSRFQRNVQSKRLAKEKKRGQFESTECTLRLDHSILKISVFRTCKQFSFLELGTSNNIFTNGQKG